MCTSLINGTSRTLSLQTPAAVTDAAKRKAAFGMDGSEVSPPWSSKTSEEEVEASYFVISCDPNFHVFFLLLMIILAKYSVLPGQNEGLAKMKI